MPTSDHPDAPLAAPALNKRIIPIVFFTFVCYLTIGIPLAILPGFTHITLGFSTLLAGIAISLQYFSTLASRPYAGRCADLLGPKKIVLIGLLCCALSGACYMMARATTARPVLSLCCLLAGRLLLGVGERFASTGSMLWGIGAVGQRHTGRVISWNGVATYGAIAVGAPLGVLLNNLGGLTLVGGFILFAGIGTWRVALRRPAVSVSTGRRIPFSAVVGKVWLFGLVLGLGTLGFGVIVSFITLYFAERGWSGAGRGDSESRRAADRRRLLAGVSGTGSGGHETGTDTKSGHRAGHLLRVSRSGARRGRAGRRPGDVSSGHVVDLSGRRANGGAGGAADAAAKADDAGVNSL